MRTNQIGILEAAPSRQEDIGGAYYLRPTRDEPPPYYTQGDGRFADISSMFLANGVKQSTQTAVNGVQNGIFNGPMTSQNGQAVPPSR